VTAHSRIAALEESLAATQDALREAIADARRNAEERDDARAQVISDCNVLNQEIDECRSLSESLNGQNVALSLRIVAVAQERDALLAEVKAWRGYDRAINQKDRMALLSDALRLREQNEGGERG
jgi:uncharacterized coiled-coil DUF342 family protein